MKTNDTSVEMPENVNDSHKCEQIRSNKIPYSFHFDVKSSKIIFVASFSTNLHDSNKFYIMLNDLCV